MIHRFGTFELDEAAQELRRDGAAVAVEPQVFALMALLVRNSGRLVGKDEIVEAIWQGRAISDAALSSRIKAARQALGDTGKDQRHILTVRKRGFRFVAPLEQPVSGATAMPCAAPDPHPESIRPPELPAEPSVVVLPFRTLGDPNERAVLAQGLTHDLITRLGRARWLFVIARGTAFHFAEVEHDPLDAAARLGVRYIVQGAVQAAAPRIRVHATLIDAVTRSEIWSEHYDRGLDDLFSIQSDISDAIAGAVEAQIEHAERGRSRLKPSESLDAWEAYHRGCWHMYRFRAEHYEEAERFFLRSIELDPTSPRPFAGLSFVHWQRAFLELRPDRQGEIVQARELAEQAIALDPRDPQGYHALGRAYHIGGDLAGAERELQAAVDLNPSFALGHYSLAFSLFFSGLTEESLNAVGRAQRLSPFDPMGFAMSAIKAMDLARFGEFDEATRLADLAARQSNAHYHILAVGAHIHHLAGNSAGAAAYLGQLRALRPDYSADTYLRAFPMFRRADIESARLIFSKR